MRTRFRFLTIFAVFSGMAAAVACGDRTGLPIGEVAEVDDAGADVRRDSGRDASRDALADAIPGLDVAHIDANIAAGRHRIAGQEMNIGALATNK